MKIKKIITLFIVILSIFISGNVFAQSKNNEEVDVRPNTLGIQKIVEDKTPPFIKRIIEKTINTTEAFRIGTWQLLESKRINAKKNLEKISPTAVRDITEEQDFEDSFNDVVKESKEGVLLKPLKQAELFFLTATAAYFKNSIAFYLISIILIFFVFRTLTKQ